jgi:hypothetical protein
MKGVMRYKAKILAAIVQGLWLIAILGVAGCVEFKELTFYDGVEPEIVYEKPDNIELVVEPVIYAESTSDVWGLEKNECQEASVTTEVAYSGEQSIKLQWDRNAPGCTWAGIGVGWEGYAGKDLSEIMEYAAIQIHVRSQEGKMFGLPFVLTLEDYSGGMGFCYTSNKYFERSSIDEEWQKVIVPLKDFDLETENLDITNIKQLQIELQQSGAVYLDELELIFHTPEPQEPWLVEEELPSPTALPIVLFDDRFINNNGWGLMADKCQNIALTEAVQSEGRKSVHVRWDNSAGSCHLTAFGVSWNKWHPVDVTSIRNSAAIQFDIKITDTESRENLSVKVGFEDYDRQKTSVTLQSAYATTGRYSAEWATVRIPLYALPDGVDFTRIKHLFFDMEGKGSFYMDNLKLVEIK